MTTTAEWRGIPPSITPENRAFWEAAREHRFLLLRCAECGAWYWPYSGCRFHGNRPYLANMEWQEASGRAKVFTFNIHYLQFNPAYPTPYVYAQVETDEGPLFGTNIVNCAPESVYVGMPVRVVFDDVAPDISLPKFEPVP
jgi:uncharacterized OB-fold protein